MATNKQLIEDILAIDANADTEGLKNEELAALLKKLRSDKKASEVTTPASEVTTPAAEVTTPAAEVTTPAAEVTTPAAEVTKADDKEPTKVYIVVDGKAITSRRGVLDSGEEVKAEYFVGGDDTLADLIERKLVKVK